MARFDPGEREAFGCRRIVLRRGFVARFVGQNFGVGLSGELELGLFRFTRCRLIARSTSCTRSLCDCFGGGFAMKDCPLVIDAVGPFIARANSPVSLAARVGPERRSS